MTDPSEIVKRLRDDADFKSGSSFNNSCPACGLCSNLMQEAASLIEAQQEESERLREALELMINLHDDDYPVRTADFHGDDCDCVRCLVDGARSALQQKE
jgi:hypothetical protein